MNIHETIKSIKEQISLCEQTGDMFDLPEITKAKVEVNDLPNEGADLFHREYKINLADGESIHIDYHSKIIILKINVVHSKSIQIAVLFQ